MIATATFAAPLVSVSGVTTYTVTARRASDGAVLATSAPSTERTVRVTGLRNGTAVYLTVTAAELGLTLGPASQPSNTVTPFGPPFAPGAPRADCTPPAACDGQVSLAFDPPEARPDGTPGDNGAPITSYAVTAHGYDDTVLGTASFPSTSGVFPGLTNGESYTFTVVAVNAAGPGAASPASTALTPAGLPYAPADVTAYPQVGAALVSWIGPYDNGSPVDSYTVTAAPGGASVTATESVATVSGLVPGTAYTFTVVARNAVGTGPASAASAPVTPLGPPGAPTGVVATPGDGWATVSWSAPSERGGDSSFLGYRVTASPGGASRYVVDPTTTATVTGLTPGTAYTFTVTATNGTGPASSPSAPVTVTGGAASPPGGPPGPGAPSNLSVSTAHRQATVRWTDDDPAVVSFTVMACRAFSTSDTRSATVAAPSSSVTVFDLTDGDSYFFTVVATNAAGGQTSSVSSDLTTLPALLVGLGDSYASGEGDPPYESGTEDPKDGCRRSIYRGSGAAKGEVGLAPYIAAPALTAVNVACSGAKIAKVLDESFNGEPPQLSRLTGDERYLSLTVGGDALEPNGLRDLIDACVNVPPLHYRDLCQDTGEAKSPSLTEKIDNLRMTLASTYRRLLDAAPFADLYVFGYPKIFGEQLADACEYVRISDTAYLNSKVIQLDGVIAQAVADVNTALGSARVHYVNVIGPFEGHGLCTGATSYFNSHCVGPATSAPYYDTENSDDTPFHPSTTRAGTCWRVVWARKSEMRNPLPRHVEVRSCTAFLYHSARG